MATQNFSNRTIFHGGNLPSLRNTNSESVKLIATDPPFNKNRDFHASAKLRRLAGAAMSCTIARRCAGRATGARAM